MTNTYVTDRFCGFISSPIDINNIELIYFLLKWDTDTDWNKGDLGADVAIVGTGASAKIAPKGVVWPGSEVYVNWRFNETSGTSAADSSYYNRPGTLVTGEGALPAIWVAGKLNNAISNPGEFESTDYVEGGDISEFDWDDTFSIECWFNQTAGYDVSMAGNYNSTETKGWWLGIQEGYLRFNLIGDVSNYIQVYSDIQVTPGIYQHLVVTYDGSGNAAGVKFYLDGVLLGTTITYDLLAETSIVPTTNNFRVGAIADTAWGWIGQIDEFNLYAVVLSQANVDFRYNAGTGTETPVFTQEIYPTTAHYETNIADSKIVNLLWGKFNYTRTVPSGTTVVVKCRVSDDSNAMGSYGATLIPGEDIALRGQFIQFSVDFTGTDLIRSLVDFISCEYTAPLIQVVLP